MRSTLSFTLLFLALIAVPACLFVDAEDNSVHHHTTTTHGAVAVAVLEGKSGSPLTGNASFSEVEGGVLVQLTVENTPPGAHAVHLHVNGDCSSDDGKSAGGHFNPAGVDHGAPHAMVHHAGDLGNMWVGDNGRGHHALFMPELTVAEGPTSVVGRSIIVHAGADDLTSQPTGAAGGRIGCGVIE